MQGSGAVSAAPRPAWAGPVKKAESIFRTVATYFAVALAVLGAAAAHARTVTNVASARWNDAGQDYTVQSNQVSFDVVVPPTQLSTFTPLPGASDHADLRANYCAAEGNAPESATVTTVSTPLLATTKILIGQNLVVQINSPQGNLDPDAIDTIEVQFKTPQGDQETITAVETSADSGMFYGSIATIPDPPQFISGDCKLSLVDSDQIQITAMPENGGAAIASAKVDAQADPFGMVFDSFDGRPVNGAQITLINDATGQPAKVFAYDGVTPYPSTVVSGQQVSDGAGHQYQFGNGEYVFPLTALGNYHLQIQPPAPYTAPSHASPAALALLRKPSGAPFEITPASFGASFAIASLEPLQVDVPVDAPGADITVTKQVSKVTAQPGDMLSYKVVVRNADGGRSTRQISLTDTASAWLRIRPESVRVDGHDAGAALALASDGHGYTLALAPLEPQGQHTVTYMMTVRADAPPGQAVNRATGKTQDGLEADAQAMVKITRDSLTDRMTLIGQVTAGDCTYKGPPIGVPGVRVMLEDGSFVVTDRDGRYHFEGLVPGTHVVQAAPETLPQGGHFIDCSRSTHNAGRANSFFVRGQGGSLARADFHAVVPAGALAQAAAPAKDKASDREAAGAETDWFKFGDGPPAFLFPGENHNPRSPSVRVVVREGTHQTVTLTANGDAVDPLSFDSTNVSPDGHYAVSIWRAIRLKGNFTHLVATVKNPDGSVAATIERDVRFADTPMHGVIVKDQSHLLADGVSKPVLAVRLTDRYGNPVHAGVSGTFTVNSPYQSASAVEAQQSKALTGFGSASASWLVEGDDGIAHIELAPTMVSGALHVNFQFSDGDTHREEALESWIQPGNQPWTLVGLAEGAIGSESVAKNMERDGADFDSDLGKNARVAFYAKGRVLGKYLLTVAYDSAKQKADQQLLGIIDPSAYYTVFGDNTQRLYDAASQEKLYVRVESAAFYALFGDFDTGFDQTTLAAYQRTLTGVKGEAQFGKVHVNGFVAKTSSTHVRDEIQGNGLTGPYRLSNRAILANSEHVSIQVRDRLRSELILDQRDLVRFVDYEIDMLSGTITFTQPVLSRDDQLNPQFIVIDYEVDGSGKSEWNGGVRSTWTSNDGKVRIGATGITDKADTGDRTTLGAADVRVRIGTTTEIRVEAGASTKAGEVSKAGSVEIEHRTGKVDVLAYAHQTDADYGVGQQNLSERGQRKFGTDARLSITDQLSITTSAWLNQSLVDAAEQKAVEVRGAWRTQKTDAYLGVSYLSESTPTGTDGASTVLEAGVTQHLLGNRLEISGASSLALSNTEAIDLPTRHQLGLRYSITPTIKAVATYEIARGDKLDSNTLKAGVEFTPWQGATVTTTLGKQDMGAGVNATDANRTFAAFALGQNFQLSPKLTIDATVDGNKTLGGGIPLSAVVNPSVPVSSGGQLGDDGSLGEDFMAYSLGLSWQSGPWSARVRGEYRNGEFEDQKGFTFAAIRQLGEGSVVGSGVTWTWASSATGTTTEVTDAQASFAHRPAGSDISFLGKLEYRVDKVTGAVAGQAGPVGATALTVDGNANSTRLIASLSTNWTPTGADGTQRSEVAVFTAVRHNFESYEGFDLKGTSLFGGVDARIGLGDRFEIGGKANVRGNIDEGTISYSVGPEIGFSPADNMVLTVGYNLAGFHDRDFSEAQSTDKGVFASLRMKFDAGSFNFLGLGSL